MSLNNLQLHHKRAVLLSLETLPPVDVTNIFQEFLSESKRLQLSPKNPKTNIQWVYVICKRALLPIRLLESYSSFLASEISEYSMWLQLDAISTRALIYEACDSLHQARIDLQLITRMIKSFPSPVDQMKKSLRTIVLYAACRLPLLETQLQMYSEALASYRLCVSGDPSNPAPLSNYYSIPLLIALSNSAADLILIQSYLGQLEGEMLNKSEEFHIEVAYNLLSHAKNMMSENVRSNTAHQFPDTSQTVVNSIVGYEFNFPQSSMQSIIPNWGKQLQKTFRHISAGRLAVSLAAVEVYIQCSKDSIKSELHDPSVPLTSLEWGLLSDPRPSLELLWNISVFYTFLGGRIEEGVDIMRQCISLAAHTTDGRYETYKNNETEDITISHRRGLLSWLGLGPQPGYELQHLPSLLAAHISLTALGNPEMAILCANEGLRELFPDKGSNFSREMESFINTSTSSDYRQDVMQEELNLVKDTPRQPRGLGSFFSKESAIFHTAEFTPDNQPKKFLQNDIIDSVESSWLSRLTCSTASLVLIIARSYAAWARNCLLISSSGPDAALLFRDKSIGIFRFLMSQNFCDALQISSTELGSSLRQPDTTNLRLSITLRDHMTYCIEYATVLAEVGDISPAIELLRKYLVDMGHDDDIQLTQSVHVSPVLHLLSILLSCTKGDEQVAIITLQLCSEALFISNKIRDSYELHQNIRPNFSECLLAYLKIDRCSPSGFSPQITLFEILNIKYTLARIKWSMGEKETSLRLIDDVVNPLLKIRDEEIFFPFSFIEVQLKVKLLVGSSQLYRLVNNDIKSQLCVEEAWRTLYSFTPSISSPYVKANSTFTGLPGQNDLKLLLSQKNISRPLTSSNSSAEAKPIHSDLRWLDMLRRVPTIPGWKLPEACGWGSNLPRHSVADVLSECADIVRCQGKIDGAIELLHIAVAMYPQHLRSLLSLAEIELQLHEDANASTKNEKYSDRFQSSSQIANEPTYFLLQAYHHAQMAVDFNKLNPQGWYVVICCSFFSFQIFRYILGTCLQALGAFEKAADAFVTSLEYQQYLPLRDFSDILY